MRVLRAASFRGLVSGALLLSFSLSARVQADAGEYREPIPLSEMVYPLSTYTQLLWISFVNDSGFPRWVRQAASRRFGDGTVLFHRPDGSVGGKLIAYSKVTQDRRARNVQLSLHAGDGTRLFRFEFNTRGEALQEIPLEKVIQGQLPFYPVESAPSATEFTLSLGSELIFRARFTRDRRGVQEFIRADFVNSRSESFLIYEERSDSVTREISYVTTNETQFRVLKTVPPGHWEGTESYWVNGKSVSLSDYIASFTSSLPMRLATHQWPSLLSTIDMMIRSTTMSENVSVQR